MRIPGVALTACTVFLGSVGCGVGRREYVPTFYPYAGKISNPSTVRVPQEPVSIASAIEIALANYPAIRAARARVDAASAGVDLAGTAYLPRIDLLWQEVRATRNNVSSQFLPQGVVPGISGPVSDRSWDSAWASMGGVLFSYEPFDFGLRGAYEEAARASVRQAEAEVQATRLDVAASTADAFLALIAAQEAARAAQANVDRWEVFARAVHALVNQQLRPGADASRADAELALALNQNIHARQVMEVGRLTLAETMGLGDVALQVDPGPLLSVPSVAELPAFDFLSHPLLARQGAAIETAEARRAAIDRAYYPRVNLQFSFSDRGSGFGSTGEELEPIDGLYPDRYNWVAGVTVTFPVMERFQLNARGRVEEGVVRAERARADQIALNLRMQDRRIRTVFDASRRMAENTPTQLKAAQEAFSRSRSRYDTGLGTLTEVAESQRLLTQAEIDDALAKLGIWRAVAAAARVQGDVAPFLKVVASTPKKDK